MRMKTLVLLFGCAHAVFSQLPDLDQCPPEDPNCHPSCIEYINKCRVCRCKINDLANGDGFNSGFSSSLSTGFGTDTGTGFGDGFGSVSGSGFGDGFGSASGSGFGSGSGNGLWQSSSSGGLSNSGNSWTDANTGNNKQKTKIIVIEKEKEPEMGMAFPGSTFTGGSPFQINSPGPIIPPHTLGISYFPPAQHSIPEGCTNFRNVKLISPGVPMYCVTGTIIGCPAKCVLTDEYGCKSCPCAPASKIMMPVCDMTSAHKEPQAKNKCVGTALCITTCKGEARIGETGPDGCQKCTCIKKDEKTSTTTTPKPKVKDITECNDLIMCMIKCKDTGYEIGDKTENGCPKCRCKQTDHKTTAKANNNPHWSMTTPKPGSNNNNGGGMMGGFGSGSGSGSENNWLLNPDQGVSGGSKCEPPMCQGGSVNPMNIGGSLSGFGGGSSSSGSGTGTGGGSSCAGPFCATNALMGGSGSGSGNSGGMGSGSSSGGVTPPKSPFMSAMGGGGGGGGSGGAAGPFASSLSAGGGSGGGMGGMGSSMGSPFMAAAGGDMNTMHGPVAPMNPGKPTMTEVHKEAYNEECFGPSCSAKNGRAHGLIGNCIDMEKCIEECEGSYVIGSQGHDGCQSCTCSR